MYISIRLWMGILDISNLRDVAILQNYCFLKVLDVFRPEATLSSSPGHPLHQHEQARRARQTWPARQVTVIYNLTLKMTSRGFCSTRCARSKPYSRGVCCMMDGYEEMELFGAMPKVPTFPLDCKSKNGERGEQG